MAMLFGDRQHGLRKMRLHGHHTKRRKARRALESTRLSIAAEASAHGAGGFNNPRGRLRSLGLIEYVPGGKVKARSLLFLE
jgi:hypothetical protein